MPEKTNKDVFIEIYNRYIKRPGAYALLKWLEKNDFFTAPASTKYHLCEAGGLVQHSLHVYWRLKEECKEAKFKGTPPSDETIAIVGLLHDLCKTGFYKEDTRNQKNKTTGKWETVPYYTVDDQIPYGHGEKSAMIIASFMRLTGEEMFAIRWHMGAYDDAVKGGSFCLNAVYKMFPLALLVHIADLKATWLDEC